MSGLDVWFKNDVARILASLHQASVDGAASGDNSGTFGAGYRQGHDDALHAVAVAFGLAEPKPRGGAVESEAVWRVEDST